MANQDIRLAQFDDAFLNKSWVWLRDPQIQSLTMTPNFTREQQLEFFAGLPYRSDYKIWGIYLTNFGPVGAAGLKNITDKTAEYWGYIGEKEHWGKGYGQQIMNLVEGAARDMSLTSLYLLVSSHNLRAIRLYEKNCYSKPSRSSENGVIRMVKSL